MMAAKAHTGIPYKLELEAYAGQLFPGTQPDDNRAPWRRRADLRNARDGTAGGGRGRLPTDLIFGA